VSAAGGTRKDGQRFESTIVAAHGRRYFAEDGDHGRIDCVPRGKKSDIACGDRVELERIADGQAVIVRTLPRQSLLHRSDAWKQKLIAANVSQVIVVVATEPPFSDMVLTRCLIAAEHQALRAVIVLNKCDLADRVAACALRLKPFADLGYRVVQLAAAHDASALAPLLAGQTSVLVGQSGMGKSTLINALIPGAGSATREISAALQSGKHTTTHATLYRLDADSALIDSPGLQEFGLAHLSFAELEQAFVDFKPYLGRCRFRNCHHDHEPDCALRHAVAEGAIAAPRLAAFAEIARSLATAAGGNTTPGLR
jgi:ribosome biogenesis GTPase